jgi:protein-S-isoprenylcysteine O-methyltransferase Ste14
MWSPPRDLPFHLVFLAAMIALAGVRVHYWRATRTLRGYHGSGAGSAISELRQLGGILAFLLITVHIVRPSLLDWTEFPLPLAIRLVAVPVVNLSVLGVAWAARAAIQCLGTAGTNQLITSGPYRIVRHPLYSAVTVAAVALTVVSANWVVGLIALALVSHLLLSRAPHEEAALSGRFGEAYREYAEHTPRFVPRRWRR